MRGVGYLELANESDGTGSRTSDILGTDTVAARAVEVDPATRERVLKVAEHLGYQPNRAARGLITGRTVLEEYLKNDEE